MEISNVFWFVAVAYWIYSIFGGRKKPKPEPQKATQMPKDERRQTRQQDSKKPVDAKELEWLKKINPELYKQFTGKSAEPEAQSDSKATTRKEKYVRMNKEQRPVEVLNYETTPKEKWQSRYKAIVVEPSKRQLLAAQEKNKKQTTPIDVILKNKSLLKQAFIFSEIIKPKY